MLPPNKSSPRSSVAASITHFQRRTLMASPLSPCHYDSILSSPVLVSTQALGLTPDFSSPLGKSIPGSPAKHTVASHSSPSNRVSDADSRYCDPLLPVFLCLSVHGIHINQFCS